MSPSKPSNTDPFFIGWRPVPPTFRRLLIPVAAGLLLAFIIIAFLLGRGQQSPAGGTWDTDHPVTLTGVAYAEPYAMLRVATDPPRTLLLVDDGKAGAAEMVRQFDGQPVRVTGTILRGEGIELLELIGEPQPIEMSDADQARIRRSPPRIGPSVVLTGEVVDSKCHLGAMRPGRGKGHRGCAALCLRGGVPPLYVAGRPGAEDQAYLMVGWTNPELIGLLGRRVERALQIEWWDDLPVVRPVGAPTRP